MATRKELMEQLRDSMGELSDAVEYGSANLQAASDASLRRAEIQAVATAELASAVTEASHELIPAAVVGSLGAWVADATTREVRRINATTQMMDSVLRLQTKYGRLSYEFIVERSFMTGADREQKQNTLNELILGGVVESTQAEDGEWFHIDVDNPLLEWWQKTIEALEAGENPPERPALK